MPWKPGESGNPDGGRSRKFIRDAIYAEFAMMGQGRVDPVPKLSVRQMVRAQIAKACEGDVNAFHAIADRAEGKPKQVLVGDAEDDPIMLAALRGDDARLRLANALTRLADKVIEGELVESPTQSNDLASDAQRE